MLDPNLDPGVENAARKVFDAAADLETASLRAERTDIEQLWSTPTPVTGGLLAELAAMPNSSPALKDYAERVRAGECQWEQIELLARPVPPEIAELKSSPSFRWDWTPPATPVAVPAGVSARRPQPKDDNVVGPSDWPDDFDEYPTQRSWLV
ncbi:hypothetical protein [Nocardia veterana]|uniref:Uncharacterized protein n=1 Tax=Nocardia veterana TaxID=132249 RepID=A0A7X6LXI6_9NOCA|nr:hypothetical protein [Nocardia veterana]NKY86373.1 hypothetical protein [Nocardia veterana]